MGVRVTTGNPLDPNSPHSTLGAEVTGPWLRRLAPGRFEGARLLFQGVETTTALSLVDLDGDGRLDVVHGDEGSEGIHVFTLTRP